MKKVLIITYYWPPSGGGGVQRWVKFVKYLRGFQWEPVVFAPENANYPLSDETLSEEIPKDIQVWKYPIVEPYDYYNLLTGKKRKEKIHPNFLSEGKKLSWKDKVAVWIRGNFFIPDARFLWIRPAAKFLKKKLEINPVDAIISTGPPHSTHLIAKRIHSDLSLPWIVDYRDPWTQIDYFNDLHLTTFAKKLHQKLEKSVLNTCNHIITVGKSMAEELNEISSTPKSVITNGYDDEDFSFSGGIPKDFNVTYLGVINESRNPESFWKAFHNIITTNDAFKGLKIHIAGQIDSFTSERIKISNIEKNVVHHGYVNHSKALELMNNAGILLLVINRTKNNKTILTGKIFEYIASGKPILCLGPKDGDAADILKEVPGAQVFDYDDVNGITSFILESYIKFRAGNYQEKTSGNSTYNRRNLTQKLANILNDITEE